MARKVVSEDKQELEKKPASSKKKATNVASSSTKEKSSSKSKENKKVSTSKITTKKATKKDNTKTIKSKKVLETESVSITNPAEEKMDAVTEEKQNIKKVDNKKILLNGSFKTIEVVGVAIITCVVSLIIGSLVTANYQDNKQKLADDETLDKIIETYEYIKENYYGEIDSEKMIRDIVEAMVGNLEDPYSTFFDENSAKNFNITLEGQYRGIGVEITNDQDGNIKVLRVFDGSPAKNAGLQVGDIITAVNGVSFLGKSSSEFVAVVRDGNETEFNFEIKRNDKIISMNINKDHVVIDSVRSKIFEKNNKKIGYIDVDIFAANTYEQFKEKLEALEKSKIDSLIIDLRDNTGGHLSAARDLLSLFLDSSHVIYQTESKKEIEKVYSQGKETKKYKVVILANSATASASEIVIAALKEEMNAMVVGASTFGKGTVQEMHKLPTGEQYKFTTKRWLTPKGNWINGQGITPDYVLYPSEAYLNNPVEENDNLLNRALDLLK